MFCLHACLLVCRDWKRVLDSLELELTRNCFLTSLLTVNSSLIPVYLPTYCSLSSAPYSLFFSGCTSLLMESTLLLRKEELIISSLLAFLIPSLTVCPLPLPLLT